MLAFEIRTNSLQSQQVNCFHCNLNMVIFLQEYWVCWLFKVKNLRIRSSIIYLFTNFYEFPLAARCSETTKNTVDKVQKRKKEREGANNECTAKLPSEGGGGIFFLCFFLCSHPVFNVMLIYSKPCKTNDSSFFKFESV